MVNNTEWPGDPKPKRPVENVERALGSRLSLTTAEGKRIVLETLARLPALAYGLFEPVEFPVVFQSVSNYVGQVIWLSFQAPETTIVLLMEEALCKMPFELAMSIVAHELAHIYLDHGKVAESLDTKRRRRAERAAERLVTLWGFVGWRAVREWETAVYLSGLISDVRKGEKDERPGSTAKATGGASPGRSAPADLPGVHAPGRRSG